MKGKKTNSNHGKKSNMNSKKKKNYSNDKEKKEENSNTNGKGKIIKITKKKVNNNQNKIKILDDDAGVENKKNKVSIIKEPMKILKYEPASQDDLFAQIKIKFEKKEYNTIQKKRKS